MSIDYSVLERRAMSHMVEAEMRATENDARVRAMAREIDQHITDALLYGLQNNNRVR